MLELLQIADNRTGYLDNKYPSEIFDRYDFDFCNPTNFHYVLAHCIEYMAETDYMINEYSRLTAYRVKENIDIGNLPIKYLTHSGLYIDYINELAGGDYANWECFIRDCKRECIPIPNNLIDFNLCKIEIAKTLDPIYKYFIENIDYDCAYAPNMIDYYPQITAENVIKETNAKTIKDFAIRINKILNTFGFVSTEQN